MACGLAILGTALTLANPASFSASQYAGSSCPRADRPHASALPESQALDPERQERSLNTKLDLRGAGDVVKWYHLASRGESSAHVAQLTCFAATQQVLKPKRCQRLIINRTFAATVARCDE
jgi:hypothetical protein